MMRSGKRVAAIAVVAAMLLMGGTFWIRRDRAMARAVEKMAEETAARIAKDTRAVASQPDTMPALLLPGLLLEKRDGNLVIQLYNPHEQAILLGRGDARLVVEYFGGKRIIPIERATMSDEYEIPPGGRTKPFRIALPESARSGKVRVRFEFVDRWGTYGTGKTLEAYGPKTRPGR